MTKNTPPPEYTHASRKMAFFDWICTVYGFTFHYAFSPPDKAKEQIKNGTGIRCVVPDEDFRTSSGMAISNENWRKSCVIWVNTEKERTMQEIVCTIVHESLHAMYGCFHGIGMRPSFDTCNEAETYMLSAIVWNALEGLRLSGFWKRSRSPKKKGRGK